MEIKTCLNILGLDLKNSGTSTGSISFPSSKLIDSISPVDSSDFEMKRDVIYNNLCLLYTSDAADE